MRKQSKCRDTQRASEGKHDFALRAFGMHDITRRAIVTGKRLLTCSSRRVQVADSGQSTKMQQDSRPSPLSSPFPQFAEALGMYVRTFSVRRAIDADSPGDVSQRNSFVEVELDHGRTETVGGRARDE